MRLSSPASPTASGEALPLIVRKSDEGFGYAASDLAAVRDRVANLHADEMLYVVGVPQAQHFEMVFAVARMAGWLPERVRCEHVTFGNVLGPDRKMFKSRSGDTVKLASLLDEAIEARRRGAEGRNTDLDEMARTELAVEIARAAIKYADLSTDRHHDYIFDLDRMIAFEGDTGPYLQYAHARLKSIFRRLGAPWDAPSVSFSLDTPQERHLGARAARVSRGVPIVAGVAAAAPPLCLPLRPRPTSHRLLRRLSGVDLGGCFARPAIGAVRPRRANADDRTLGTGNRRTGEDVARAMPGGLDNGLVRQPVIVLNALAVHP